MRSEKLMDALGKIDDRLVMEVFPGMPIRKKKHWPTLLAAAAMVAVCLMGAARLGIWPQVVQKPPVSGEEASVPEGMDWDAVEEKLLTAPDPYGISDEIKLEFLRYFQENYDYTFETLLTWEWRFAMSDAYQNTVCPTLCCTGITVDGIQTNEFVYYEGAVQFACRKVEPFEDVSEAIHAAFPDENITAAVQLKYRLGILNGVNYELLPSDGLDLGGKTTLSDALYLEELDLTGRNSYNPSGTLVFVDNSQIPSYFVEAGTMKVFVTRSGKVTNGYQVWAAKDAALAGEYEDFLLRAQAHLYEKREEKFEMQYILRGTVLEIDYDANMLTLDGTAQRYDQQGQYTGEMRLAFTESDKTFITENNFFMKAYVERDYDAEGANNMFYSVEYANERIWPIATGLYDSYQEKAAVYHKILANQEPLQGNSCSIDIGDYDLCLELPKDWMGKYGMSILEDGVQFYHLASKDTGVGGHLFTIKMVTEEEMIRAGFERILFEGDKDMIGLFTPTDVQFSAETAEEYQAMQAQIEAIADSAFLEAKQEKADVID